MDGSTGIDTAPMAPTEAPPPQNISHWENARTPALAKKPKVPNPLPDQISGQHARKAAEALRNMCSWSHLPGGHMFWASVASYLEGLAMYADGAQPHTPIVPTIMIKAVE